jgi:RPA family protein
MKRSGDISVQSFQPRQIAIRASISDIVDGQFIEAPSKRVVSPYGVEMRRVVVVGLITEHFVREADEEKKRYESMTIDDGSGTVRLKVWGDGGSVILRSAKEGALALVVGKVEKYGDEIHIDPELVKEVTDPNIMSLHLLERYETILRRTGISLPETSPYQQETLVSESKKQVSRPVKKQAKRVGGVTGEILAFIRENAGPDGVHMKDIVSQFEKKDMTPTEIQEKVFNLYADDAIFEVSAARYRPLDD